MGDEVVVGDGLATRGASVGGFLGGGVSALSSRGLGVLVAASTTITTATKPDTAVPIRRRVSTG